MSLKDDAERDFKLSLLRGALMRAGSVSKLAEYLNLNRSTVAGWVRGSRVPHTANILKLQKYLEEGEKKWQ